MKLKPPPDGEPKVVLGLPKGWVAGAFVCPNGAEAGFEEPKPAKSEGAGEGVDCVGGNPPNGGRADVVGFEALNENFEAPSEGFDCGAEGFVKGKEGKDEGALVAVGNAALLNEKPGTEGLAPKSPLLGLSSTGFPKIEVALGMDDMPVLACKDPNGVKPLGLPFSEAFGSGREGNLGNELTLD